MLDIFAANPTRTYLFNEIKAYAGSKSESYIYGSLQSFVKEGVLIKEKRGGVTTYQVAESPKAISFLAMTAEFNSWNKKNIPLDSIKETIRKAKLSFLTLIVTGSYVKGKQTSGSDLDLVLIVPSEVKKVTARLKHFGELNIPPIHLYVFTDEEFKQMLLEEKHNYGKEIVKNNLLFFGAENYYTIMLEARKHGFTY